MHEVKIPGVGEGRIEITLRPDLKVLVFEAKIRAAFKQVGVASIFQGGKVVFLRLQWTPCITGLLYYKRRIKKDANLMSTIADDT